MSIVHHMILFGSSSHRMACSSLPGRIIYAWARTGQTTPIGLDFLAEKAPTGGLGFAIGEAAGLQWVSLQIHYQRPERVSVYRNDTSGIRLSISRAPPRTPLRVQLNQLVPYVPARSVVDQCIRCMVIRGGWVFAYRNHAHRLGRDIWSDHFRHGRDTPTLPTLGLMDSQQPQIVRLLSEPRKIEAGDVLQLHCVYNGTSRDKPTGYDIDEAKGEMCNQVLPPIGPRLASWT